MCGSWPVKPPKTLSKCACHQGDSGPRTWNCVRRGLADSHCVCVGGDSEELCPQGCLEREGFVNFCELLYFVVCPGGAREMCL